MAYLVGQNESLSVSSLSMQIMQRIKQEYSYLNNIKLENLNLEYFGNYNGYYAVIMYDITTGVAAVVTKGEIAFLLSDYRHRNYNVQDKLTRIRYENLSTIYLLQKISSHTLSRFLFIDIGISDVVSFGVAKARLCEIGVIRRQF